MTAASEATADAGAPSLGAGFPQATRDQWRHLALKALRRSGAATEETGADEVEALLATTTLDGLRIGALHGPDGSPPPPAGLPGQAPYVRGGRASGGVVGGWDVRAHHADRDPKATREAVLTDLENGATSLWLTLGDQGLPIDALPEALDGVHLDLAPVVLDAGDRYPDAAAAWFDLVAARGVSAAAITGNLGADPLGWRARTGEADRLAGVLTDAATLAARCAAEAPGLRALTVDATVFHDAGGSDAEELGCAAAAGVAYLRALTDAGLTVPAALGQLEFRYAATADQFATIAKLRAARRLWARIAELCGAATAGAQRQHAVTSAAMVTARDPWVNLLRTTVAAFAAGVGGADAITVRPFDHAVGLPDNLARRLARNTQLLLVEESHVARVLDPAGGSWYVERYTADLARAAWEWFTEIEKSGGLAAALDSGLVADRLAATWRRRATDIAHRRHPITGVSEYPHLDEEPLRRAPAPPVPGGGLPRHRHAEAFERLRDRADTHLARTGARPTVFLAALGSPAAAGARLTFAANLFAAGGIATTTGAATTGAATTGAATTTAGAAASTTGAAAPGNDAVAALAAGFAASGATVACVCGPDRAYPELATPVAEALRAAGARRVWLAGRGDHPGVDGQIHVGCDALAVLTTTLADLEVPQ